MESMPRSTVPEIIQDKGVTVIALGPEYENLDEHILDDLRDVFQELSESADPPWVVVDLANTKFFGSSFLEILFRMWNHLHSRDGGRLALSGLTPYCAEVLAITHLDTLWPTFPDRSLAVTALHSPSQA